MLCVGVQLTHGWIPDASDAYQSDVLERVGTYDAAQLALVRASEAEAALGSGKASSEQTQIIQDGWSRNSLLDSLYSRAES